MGFPDRPLAVEVCWNRDAIVKTFWGRLRQSNEELKASHLSLLCDALRPATARNNSLVCAFSLVCPLTIVIWCPGVPPIKMVLTFSK